MMLVQERNMNLNIRKREADPLEGEQQALLPALAGAHGVHGGIMGDLRDLQLQGCHPFQAK